MRDGERDIVGDRDGADAALGADHGDDAADRLGVRRRKQPAYRAHHLQRADRRDQIIAHAPAHEFAIQFDVVGAADDDDARGRVAHFGELIEAGQDIFAAALRFQHDDVRRRRAVIRLDRGGETAHLDAQMRLGHTPVLAGRLDGGGGLHGFAERLYRDARRRSDLLLASDDVVRNGFRCVCLLSWLHLHSASLPQVGDLADRRRDVHFRDVAVGWPSRYFSMTVVRRCA